MHRKSVHFLLSKLLLVTQPLHNVAEDAGFCRPCNVAGVYTFAGNYQREHGGEQHFACIGKLNYHIAVFLNVVAR